MTPVTKRANNPLPDDWIGPPLHVFGPKPGDPVEVYDLGKSPDVTNVQEVRESAEAIRDALRCARNDSRLLDGRDFDEAFWDAKDAALDSLLAYIKQLERGRDALEEKPNQPLLNAARRLVKATDNAERNYALADLVAALARTEEQG